MSFGVTQSPHLWSVFAIGLHLCVCLQSPSLSVTPDFPSQSHNRHQSYTANQWVEEHWARCQVAWAPVGQSISSIQDMLSTRVYLSGLEHLFPVRTPPHGPHNHSGAVCIEFLSSLITAHQAIHPAIFGFLEHTLINECDWRKTRSLLQSSCLVRRVTVVKETRSGGKQASLHRPCFILKNRNIMAHLYSI